MLFFHGLNGLELACETGRVKPGTLCLFNGASLLMERAERELMRECEWRHSSSNRGKALERWGRRGVAPPPAQRVHSPARPPF